MSLEYLVNRGRGRMYNRQTRCSFRIKPGDGQADQYVELPRLPGAEGTVASYSTLCLRILHLKRLKSLVFFSTGYLYGITLQL